MCFNKTLSNIAVVTLNYIKVGKYKKKSPNFIFNGYPIKFNEAYHAPNSFYCLYIQIVQNNARKAVEKKGGLTYKMRKHA